MKDRAFFFTAMESYRLKRALELNVNVPTQRFRNLLMTSLPFPETKLLLDQYQLPTEPVHSTALLGVFIGAGNKENNDDHLDARVDFRIKGGNLSTTLHLRAPVPDPGEPAAGAAACVGEHDAARQRELRRRARDVELGNALRLQLQLAVENRSVLQRARSGQSRARGPSTPRIADRFRRSPIPVS